jgi:hypothetical protein
MKISYNCLIKSSTICSNFRTVHGTALMLQTRSLYTFCHCLGWFFAVLGPELSLTEAGNCDSCIHKQHCAHSAPVYDSMMTGRISKQLCSRKMPSGGLNEKLRTRQNFWNVPDNIVTSSSEVMKVDFCITNLGTPCIINQLHKIDKTKRQHFTDTARNNDQRTKNRIQHITPRQEKNCTTQKIPRMEAKTLNNNNTNKTPVPHTLYCGSCYT